MPTFDFQPILNRLSDEIAANSLKKIDLLPFDRWILASLLQKAVRRGDVTRAGSAALSLWSLNKRMFWRRIFVISVEDIGFGSIDAVLETIAICKSTAWRKKVGEGNAAVYLARRLASVPKSRFLTELYFTCDIGPIAVDARQQVGLVGFQKLKSILLDAGQPVQTRALALWATAGTRRFPAQGFSRIDGEPERVAKIIRALPAPEEIKEATIACMFDTQWPLAMFLPLAWEVFQKEKSNLHVKKEMLLSSPEFENLPVYALDALYTRSGQECARKLRKALPSLNSFSMGQVGEAMFFIENEALDKRLTSPALDDFREKSIIDVMASLGLDRDEFRILTQTLIKYWDVYNELRLQQIEKIISERKNDLFHASGINGDKP